MQVIVNAGIGKEQPIGTGAFKVNVQTARTSFVSALAQCEAAMEIFRRQNAGHLVPAWPWSVMGVAMRLMPLRLLAKFG